MDGKTLLYQVRNLINEASDSGFLNKRSTYDFLYKSAVEFVNRTNCLRTSQSITTVADQTDYTLNADFIKLFLKDTNHNLIIKYNDGSNNSFLTNTTYDKIQYQVSVSSVPIPSQFAVIDDSTLDSRISGTTTSAGAVAGGESTLTDTAADFSDVSPGDIVHNTTDACSGIVLSKTSSTVLVTALFDGTNDDWTSGDSYVIQPQGRLKIVIDPPPSTASHTITVEYIKRPEPVYSDYGVYRFPSQYANALICGAAWFYKYRDSNPNEGNSWFQIFDREVRQYANAVNNSRNSKRLVINWKGR